MTLITKSILVIIAILFGYLFVIFSKINYENHKKDKFLLKNHFPFEFNHDDNLFSNIIGNLALLIATVIIIVFYILFTLSSPNMVLILGSIFSIIAIIMFDFINIFSFKNLKLHLVSSSILFSFNLLSFVSVLFTSISMIVKNYIEYNVIINIAFSFVSIVALSLFVFNPKNKLFYKMDENQNEDGSVTYSRPKYIFLALCEWVNFIFIGVNLICFILFLV